MLWKYAKNVIGTGFCDFIDENIFFCVGFKFNFQIMKKKSGGRGVKGFIYAYDGSKVRIFPNLPKRHHLPQVAGLPACRQIFKQVRSRSAADLPAADITCADLLPAGLCRYLLFQFWTEDKDGKFFDIWVKISSKFIVSI